MKFSKALFLTPLGAAAAAAAATPQLKDVKQLAPRETLPYYLEFHYSNNFVQVGDTDLFNAVWQKGYGSGDDTGIETDDTYTQYGARAACVWSDSDPDLRVNVKLSGEWGVVSGVPGMTVRNQLVKTMWELIGMIQEEDGVIWKDCRDCGLAGCSDDPNAVCGQFRSEMCACNKNRGGGSEAMDLCFGSSTKIKIPSEMSLTLYNSDGSLRADSLSVTTTSAEIVVPKRRCGRLFAAGEVLVGLIPEFGSYINDQVKVACRVT